MSNPLVAINMQIEYYRLPVIEKLSDFEKGVHKGRMEGLVIARDEILKYVEKYRKEKWETAGK